jgi:hypothetical protein
MISLIVNGEAVCILWKLNNTHQCDFLSGGGRVEKAEKRGRGVLVAYMNYVFLPSLSLGYYDFCCCDGWVVVCVN